MSTESLILDRTAVILLNFIAKLLICCFQVRFFQYELYNIWLNLRDSFFAI